MNQIPKDMLLALARRGVPERTTRACFEPLETDATRQTINGESIVTLAGTPGVGKSVAALLWLWRVGDGKPELMRWIQSGDLARGFAYDAEAFDHLTGVWALVIDDLGLEYLDEKGRFLELLEEVLSKRFARMRKTLLTTNITDAALFAKRYRDRLTSRMHEDGAFIVCGGPDLRKKAA